jgi:hypothetical protein
MSEPITSNRKPRQADGRLTDEQLANLITRERPYKVFDGNSLFVLVAQTGLRSWRWRYYIRGREKVLLLGSYPETSLAQARAGRDLARDKVLAGIDPADEKRDAKLAMTPQPSRSDEALTQTLKAALALVDVRVLDHVITSDEGALSMAESGLL